MANPVKTYDVCFYGPGRPYVVTDHGPNVWGVCALCGAAAAHIPDMDLAAVRCGQHLLLQFEMTPGQRNYQAKAEYARLHGPSVRKNMSV